MSEIPYVGEICALLTAAFWSCSSLVFSAASARVGSVLVNISRLFLALIYLSVLLLIFRIDPYVTTAQATNLAISGVIGLAIGDSFLFRAYRQIGPRLSMLVMSIAPAIAAVLAFFVLGERLSLLGVLGIVVTVSGVGIVVNERRLGPARATPDLAIGLFSAGVAAVCQGVGLIFAKMAFMEGPINGFVAATVRIVSSLVVLLPVVLLLGRLTHPLRVFASDRKAFGLTALGSVLGPFLGISFSLMAVAFTQVGVAATLMATVPILMLPLVRYLYKEQLSWKAIGGASIAVGGVAMLFLH
jgi:drug/metabolite transporter (DMT)-like permease